MVSHIYIVRCHNLLQKPIKYKTAISLDSRKYYERFRAHSLVGEEFEILPSSQSQSSDICDELENEMSPENFTESKCRKIIVKLLSIRVMW